MLEVGCGLGDLLAAVKPARGVGVDFSPAMIALARSAIPSWNSRWPTRRSSPPPNSSITFSSPTW